MMIKPIGRVRRTLADKLQAELRREDPDAVVKAHDLHSVQGHWRTSRYADVMPWEGKATFNYQTVSLCSWETMSKLIASGLHIEWQKPYGEPYRAEIHAGKGDKE